MKQIIIIILTMIAFVSCNTTKQEYKNKPNVILIYADDLGRGMLSTFGQKIVKTPNIDKLADYGMRFENAYGCIYCAPARASLLTGMHDCRQEAFNITSGGIYMHLDHDLSMDEIKHKIHKLAKPADKDEVFLAQVAQKAGYTTAEFGKLDWGFATTPERVARHGWDYHFGYYDHVRCHGFYPPFLFENGQKIDIPGNTRIDCGKTPVGESSENYKERWNMEGKKVYSEYLIMDKLLSFMDNNNPNKTQKPFFIYFPTQLPHGPVQVPEVHPDFKNNDSLSELEKEYATMVKILDNDVGRIYSKLEELNILDNTIVVFTSDNGHAVYNIQEGRCDKEKNMQTGIAYDDISTRFYSELSGDVFNGNDGMSGLKRDNWEGGARVPLLWYWKGKIEAGAVSEQRVSNYDFLNTLAEIVGVEEVRGKDGVSYAKTLFGGHSEEREYTVTSSRTMGPSLVTKDGWKLRYYLRKNVFQLYYLPDDYREENDLINKYPERVEELKAILLKECNGNWENGYGPVKHSYKLYGVEMEVEE